MQLCVTSVPENWTCQEIPSGHVLVCIRGSGGRG